MNGLRIIGWTVAGLAVLGVVGAGAAYGFASRHGEVARIDPPEPGSFDRDLVERGASLAAIGNCGVCHTREGGAPYEGGYAMQTPFGTIYTTNITPDPEAGIGAWSLEAFRRAMHEGIDRHGRQLYPAFPYDRFTGILDEDVEAIYAYLMSEVEPSGYAAPENELGFPFNVRRGLEAWNVMNLRSARWQPDPDRDEEWNRGAYLVETVGHCGSCHSPRDWMGAEMSGSASYGGGYSGFWHAPALNASSPAPAPWTELALVDYLLDGWEGDHGIAGGPMTPVVNNLRDQSEDDAFAIAVYLMSLRGDDRPEAEIEAEIEDIRAGAEALEWGHPDAPQLPDDPLLRRGGEIFQAQCTQCHEDGSQQVPLAMSTTVNLDTPNNFLLVTMHGIRAPQGVPQRNMPARNTQIADDADMVSLAAFVRDRFTDRPAWDNLEDAVRRLRP
jgi:mono/diheme cytochrome c family protein